MNVNFNAANNPIFFSSVNNAMGQTQQFQGTNFQQVAQNLMQALQGGANSFQIGGQAGNSSFQMFGAQWGNFNQSGFLTPPAGNHNMNLGQAPAALGNFNSGLSGLSNQANSLMGGIQNSQMGVMKEMMTMMGNMMTMLQQVMGNAQKTMPGTQPMPQSPAQLAPGQGQVQQQGQLQTFQGPLPGGGHFFGATFNNLTNFNGNTQAPAPQAQTPAAGGGYGAATPAPVAQNPAPSTGYGAPKAEPKPQTPTTGYGAPKAEPKPQTPTGYGTPKAEPKPQEVEKPEPKQPKVGY